MADDRTTRFDALVTPHIERLFRVACRLLGNTADAQDLVQDTCMIACENLADLAASPHPARWLLRVQHNRFIDGFRRRRGAPVRSMDISARVAVLASDEPGPEELQQQAESERRLLAAFQQLDDTQRLLLSLRAEGHGLAEIEAITGIGREVLRARLHRARRSLVQRLEEASDAPAGVVRTGRGT